MHGLRFRFLFFSFLERYEHVCHHTPSFPTAAVMPSTVGNRGVGEGLARGGYDVVGLSDCPSEEISSDRRMKKEKKKKRK